MDFTNSVYLRTPDLFARVVPGKCVNEHLVPLEPQARAAQVNLVPGP